LKPSRCDRAKGRGRRHPVHFGSANDDFMTE
jgi:hypothetical protein